MSPDIAKCPLGRTFPQLFLAPLSFIVGFSPRGTDSGYCTLRWRVPGPGRKKGKGTIPTQGSLSRSFIQQILLHFIDQNYHVTTCYLKVTAKRESEDDWGWGLGRPTKSSATLVQSSLPTKTPAARYTWFSHQVLSQGFFQNRVSQPRY